MKQTTITLTFKTLLREDSDIYDVIKTLSKIANEERFSLVEQDIKSEVVMEVGL